MTTKRRGWNANLPTRWLTDPAIRDLTGDALATHVMGLVYGVEHETDGAIPTGALRWIIPPQGDGASITAELVTADLWDVTADGFQIIGWSTTQTTRAEMERTRKQNRERQSEYQKRLKAASQDTDTTDSRMTNALVTQPPEIRQDQANTEQPSTAVEEPAVATDWFTVPIPGDPDPSMDEGLIKPNTCRICGQAVTALDAWGLCSKVSAPHAAARTKEQAA